MRDLTAAAVNFRAEVGAVTDNLHRMESWVSRLAVSGAQLVCFPEMSVSGYDHSPRIRQVAQSVPGPATESLAAIALRHGVVITAGLAESYADSLFITQVVVDKEGLVGSYRKTHLGPFERQTFAAGLEVPVFAAGGCVFGIQLCYDTHFPELSTMQALAGAEVLFFPFASPHGTPQSRRERIMRYLPARAYDNTCYVVTCNLVGQSVGGKAFPGTALVIGVKGEVLSECVGWDEGAAMADLPEAEIERVRGTTMGLFRSHRRPELYAAVCGPAASGDLQSFHDSTKETFE